MSSPFDFFNYKSGSLQADGVSLAAIARKVGTPTYVYSAQALLEPLLELQKGLEGLDHQICFAVKANSNLSILRLLAQARAGADLVSGGELLRATQAGVPGNRIVFSGVGKTEEEMKLALDQAIYSFNVESVAELELLNRVALARRTIAPVTLRYNPNVDAKTHPHISTGLKENKFGLEASEILAIATRAPRLKAIHIQGLSIHIGSQLLSLAPLEDAFIKLKKMRARVEKALGRPLSVLDLGGGVGITYHREKPPAVHDYCRLIQKHFGPHASGPTRILIEPGRSLCGNAGVLLTQVLYRKPRGKKDFVVVDAGMNDLARPAIYGSYHEIVSLRRKPGEPLRAVDIVGPVCESTDCFATQRRLPSTLKAGDFLAILSAGAYGFSMSSNYNTRARPAEVLIHEGRAEVIRPRESLTDLLRGEEEPQALLL